MRFAAAACFMLSLFVPGFARAQPFAYVSGGAADAVGVVDLGHDRLVGVLPIAGMPSGASFNPADGFLYVARSQAGALERIDTVTGARLTIPLGAVPSAVWAEPVFPRLTYVAHGGEDRVAVVGEGFSTVPHVLVSFPTGDTPLALTGGGGRLYVANFGDATVTAIDTVNGRLVGTVGVGRNPAALALDPGAGRLYVASLTDDRVEVVDTTTLAVVDTIPVCSAPKGLAVVPGRLYVACFNDGRVNAVDTASGLVVADAASGGGSAVDVVPGPDGSRLYVAHLQSGKSVTVLDAETLAPLAAIEAPAGPIALAGPSASAPPGLERRRSSSAVAAVLAATVRRALEAAATQGTPDPDWRLVDTDMLLYELHSQTGNPVTAFNLDGGNPGGWRSVRFTGPGSAFVRSSWPTRTYDPAVDRSIVSIDASWSRRVVGEGAGALDRVALLQDGVVYRSAPSPTTGSAWQPAVFTGLTESAFLAENGDRPDFSANGAPIVFGYAVEHAGALTVTHGIDNLQLRVRRVPPADGRGVLSVSGTHYVAPDEEVIVPVRRLFGAVGAVGVRVRLHCPPGTGGDQFLVSWPDGDAADRLVQVSCPEGQPGHDIRRGWVSLEQPTGGAVVEPNHFAHLVFVSTEVSGPIQDVLNVMVLLFAGTAPGWLAPLVPLAAWLALRRSQRRGRSAPTAPPETRP